MSPRLRVPASFRWRCALIALLLAIAGSELRAQTVLVPVRHPVYEYLDRMETRYGVTLPQFSRPLARIDIARAIDSLARGPFQLTPYDRKQTVYYAREFAEELRRLHAVDTSVRVPSGERWNLWKLRGDGADGNFLATDLVGRVAFEKRQDADNLIRTSNGVQVYGYVGGHLGGFMRWYDNSAKGMLLDPKSRRTPEQGVVKGPPGSATSWAFEVAEAQFLYSDAHVVAGLMKMDRWMGSGREGAIILSDKAPSPPEFFFRVALADWLHFEFSHAWLFSDIPDTVRTKVGVKFYQTKYLASHALVARPAPSLQLSLGESIIYSESDVNVLFLIPVISFRAADRWTRASTGNSQFFFDARYTPIRSATVYGTLFIDELDLGKALSFAKTDADYQVAFTAGALFTDLEYGLTRIASETRIECSRVLPSVYTNHTSSQQYTSHQVVMGHWIGTNADIVTLTHTLHPDRGWDVTGKVSMARFGDPLAASPSFSSPTAPHVQPAFLAGHEYSALTLDGTVRWTPWHDLSGALHASWTGISKEAGFSSSSPFVPGISLGVMISYGLY